MVECSLSTFRSSALALPGHRHMALSRSVGRMAQGLQYWGAGLLADHPAGYSLLGGH